MNTKVVRPDTKGRITLGPQLTEGVSGFIVIVTTDHKIILEPQVEIPAHEKWLYENKAALQQVKRGLKDAAVGKLNQAEDFSQYLDDDTDS